MPIVNTDLKIRLSGGASNSDPNASLGGAKSSTEVTDNSTHNIFDLASGTETNAGDTEYRCVYLHNGHGSLTAKNVRIYVSSNTTSTTTEMDIGLGSSAINGTEQTIADEQTAPTSVTFSHPTDYASGLASADIPAGQHRSVWFKRIINAGTSALNDDSVTLKYDCDTDA